MQSALGLGEHADPAGLAGVYGGVAALHDELLEIHQAHRVDHFLALERLRRGGRRTGGSNRDNRGRPPCLVTNHFKFLPDFRMISASARIAWNAEALTIAGRGNPRNRIGGSIRAHRSPNPTARS